MSNLPVPKQNEVYYWEAKIYDKPENTLLSIGMSTKPYPLFRLPGMSLSSILLPCLVASANHRRYRLPQILYCLYLHRRSPIQPAIQRHSVWSATGAGRCGWCGLSSKDWCNLLHPQWQTSRGDLPGTQVAELLSFRRSQRSMHCPCQLWTGRVRFLGSEREEMGSGTHDRQPGTSTALWQRTRQHSARDWQAEGRVYVWLAG